MATAWKQIEHEILSRIDIATEAANAGVEFASNHVSDKGWRECRAIDREDNKPSAAVNVASNNGSLGKYKDLGGDGKAISFWDLFVKLGKFADWKAAREHYATVAGVELPKRSRKKKAKAKTSEPLVKSIVLSNKGLRPWFAQQFATAKEGVTVEQVRRCRFATGTWNGIRVLAFAAYRPGDPIEPSALVLYRHDGSDFPALEGRFEERKTHLVGGSRDGLIIVGTPPEFDAAELVWCCEGLTDALVLAAHLPAGQIAVTNSHGAGTFDASLGAAFAGKRVIIVMDADAAGQNGITIRTAVLFDVAAGVEVARLPYEIEKKHGKDLRDYFSEGRTFGELLASVTAAEKPTATAVFDLLAIDQPEGLTEVANAKRLVTRHGDVFRWCDPWDKALVWDGQRWALDNQRRVDSLARDVAQDLWGQITTTVFLDDKARGPAIAFAKASNKAAGIKNMLALARCDVAILPERLDTDPWLLNVANGTIDLRTGELRDHDRTDYITKLCPVAYDPSALCPTWRGFVHEILAGDDQLITYVQRLVGYCLTGSTREHILPFLYGTGSNGKSTFTGTILELLGGDYAIKAPTDLLLVKHGESHPTERADLHGKRFVACVEAEDGRRLAESLVKELTGGDKVRARRMREDFWEFTATHKIWLAANHKPVIRGTDHGIWRRVKLIPFTVMIPDERQDKALPDKLLAELPGILNWALAGCRDWLANGLAEPDDVRKATGDYRAEMDAVGAFIDDRCTLAPEAEQSSESLYVSYKGWCSENGEYCVNQRRFGLQLSERGIETRRGTGGKTIRVGIALTNMIRASEPSEPSEPSF